MPVAVQIVHLCTRNCMGVSQQKKSNINQVHDSDTYSYKTIFRLQSWIAYQNWLWRVCWEIFLIPEWIRGNTPSIQSCIYQDVPSPLGQFLLDLDFITNDVHQLASSTEPGMVWGSQLVDTKAMEIGKRPPPTLQLSYWSTKAGPFPNAQAWIAFLLKSNS